MRISDWSSDVCSSDLPGPDISRLRCLIVDDNEFMRTLMRRLLYALGARDIVESSGAREAFERLRTFAADLAFVDLMMVPTDGIELARLIRRSPDSAHRRLPIIMVSGQADLQRVQEARDAGVNEFLVKPVSAQTLLDRIGAVLLTKRQFIDIPSYFGPDRRRRQDPNYN